MTSAVATQNGNLSVGGEDPIMRDTALWRIVSSGDLTGLTDKQKADYYLYRCRQEGLNPASQPFVYMKQQGKEILYGGKNAADQLRKLHGITIRIVDQRQIQDVWQVTVETTDPNGRTDTDFGVVTLGNLKGDALANALMKAVTKAKRRVTYSICGTGVLDETELETMSGVQRMETPVPVSAPPAPAPVIAEVVDTSTGEIQGKDWKKATKEEVAKAIDDSVQYLGWSEQNLADFSAKHDIKPTKAGSILLAELLTALVEAEEAQRNVERWEQDNDEDDEPAQGTLLDADVRPADRWSD